MPVGEREFFMGWAYLEPEWDPKVLCVCVCVCVYMEGDDV